MTDESDVKKLMAEVMEMSDSRVEVRNGYSGGWPIGESETEFFHLLYLKRISESLRGIETRLEKITEKK